MCQELAVLDQEEEVSHPLIRAAGCRYVEREEVEERAMSWRSNEDSGPRVQCLSVSRMRILEDEAG